MQDTNTISGRVRLEIRNPDGSLVKDTGWIKNIITNAGKAQVASLMGDAAAVPFTYLALGTSNTAPTAADTTLNAEIVDTGLARHAAVVSQVTTTTTNDTLQLTYTWTASGAGATVQEAGIFNDPTTGTMLGHALTGAQVLTAGQSLTLTYQVKQS